MKGLLVKVSPLLLLLVVSLLPVLGAQAAPLATPAHPPMIPATPPSTNPAPATPAPLSPGPASPPTLTPVGGSWVRPGEWVSLGGTRPSLLQVPAGCAQRACALVVVSHPRGQDPARLRDSPQAQVLTGALLRAHFAVLLSDDGGPATWGSPAGLAHLGVAHARATRRFHWNGHTHALGLSMGGLMALRSALPGAPYPVMGVALIDAWADLDGAWGSAVSRRAEIETAYETPGRPDPALNPLLLALQEPPRPLFVVSSPDDTTVRPALNSDRLAGYAQPGLSEWLTVTGPHLGGNRFAPAVAGRLVRFFERLEALPASPAPLTPGTR